MKKQKCKNCPAKEKPRVDNIQTIHIVHEIKKKQSLFWNAMDAKRYLDSI